VSDTVEHGKKDFAVYVCEKVHGKENNAVIIRNAHGKGLAHGKDTKKHTAKELHTAKR
jgi:hypothetical protein